MHTDAGLLGGQNSIGSIAESVDEQPTVQHDFMDSRRRANCCSVLTFWYANPLIQAVRSNNGSLHDKMVEDMKINPKRDQQLLKYF